TAMSHVRPGVNYLEFHFAAMEVLAQGLHDWGILPVSVDEALSPAGQQHRRYLVCGIGHHLGLDVHDCSQAQWEDYMGADLEAGMVMTVEPGLYFHENDLTVPPELRGSASVSRTTCCSRPAGPRCSRRPCPSMPPASRTGPAPTRALHDP